MAVGKLAVRIPGATLTHHRLAVPSRLTRRDHTHLRLGALDVRPATATAHGDALPVLAGFTHAAISIARAASLGDAVSVVADLPIRAVAIAQAFIATACGQALTISAALSHWTIVVTTAASIAALTATVLAVLTAFTVSICGARSALRNASIVLADFAL